MHDLMQHQKFDTHSVPMEATMKDVNAMVNDQISEIAVHLNALHSDERGDNENLGRLLILALILIPLIILIAFFGQEIATAAKEKWDEVFGNPVDPGV
jgi:Flp pilus assembly protein TadB